MRTKLQTLKSAVNSVIAGSLDLSKEKYDLSEFKDKKADYCKKTIENSINDLKMFDFREYPKNELSKISEFKALLGQLEIAYHTKEFDKMVSILANMTDIHFMKNAPVASAKTKVDLPALPDEIRHEVAADLKEMQNCFNASCYRSAIILCGRILETGLHRKYYDLTGKDILETSPGIGLGNLIAKLRDRDFNFGPGLSEQIHLINQVRIYSVHRKKDVFSPSKGQTHAIILYTLDVLKKLF